LKISFKTEIFDRKETMGEQLEGECTLLEAAKVIDKYIND
jgi:hypothetical protein